MFDHISAIYHLLVDKLEERNVSLKTSIAPTAPQRKTSITTGLVDRTVDLDSISPPLLSMPTIPAVHLMNDNQSLEKFGDVEVCVESEESTKKKNNNDNYGDKYLTVRRHTVGPGDAMHQQVC